MLLRASLLYAMSVAIVLLGGVAVWQAAELNTREDTVTVLTRRVLTLRKELHETARREESAERRARIAEDSLNRQQSKSEMEGEPLAAARAKLAAVLEERQELETLRNGLEADLGKAIHELDALRAERDALKNDVAAAKSDASEARIAAERADEASVAAKKELAAVKSSRPKASERPVEVSQPAATARKSEALAVTSTGALRESEAAAAVQSEAAKTVEPAMPAAKPNQKSAAITIEPDPEAIKAEEAAPNVEATTETGSKKNTERKPAKKTGSPVAKKAKPKSVGGENTSPFFPF